MLGRDHRSGRGCADCGSTVRGKVVQFAMRCMWFRCIRAISDRTSRRGARGAGYARKCGGSNAERGTFLTLGYRLGRRDRPSGPLEVPPGPQSRGPACGGQGGPLGARWTRPDAGTYRCVKNVPRSELLPTLPTGRAPAFPGAAPHGDGVASARLTCHELPHTSRPVSYLTPRSHGPR